MFIVTVAAVARASWLRWHRRLCHSSHRPQKEAERERHSSYGMGLPCGMAWLVVRKWFQEILGFLASVCTVVYSTQSRIWKRLPRNATRLRERQGSRTQSYFLWWPIGFCNLPGSLQVLNFPVSGRAWWQDYVHLRHLQIGLSLCLPITWRSNTNDLHFERVKSWRLPSLKTNIAHENGWLNGLSSL